MNTAASPAIELAPGVWAFAGNEGYGYVPYCYALVTNAGTVLIDVTDPALIPGVRDTFKPTFLVLTHRHARCMEAEYEASFSLRVYLHPADAGAPRAGASEGTPAASCYHDPTSDEALRDLGFRFFHVPGHTPGSVFIYWDQHGGVLFTGDSVIGRAVSGTDRLSWPPAPTCDDAPRMRASVKALSLPAVRNILPSHGDPILDAEPAELARLWNELIR